MSSAGASATGDAPPAAAAPGAEALEVPALTMERQASGSSAESAGGTVSPGARERAVPSSPNASGHYGIDGFEFGVRERHSIGSKPPSGAATPSGMNTPKRGSQHGSKQAPSRRGSKEAHGRERTAEDLEREREERLERESLQKRLRKSEELVRQLKQIVRAQHGKIEELRDRIEHMELPTTNVRSMMAELDIRDLSAMKAQCDDMRQSMSRFKADALRYRSENLTLKKVNKRFKAMLDFADGHSPRSLAGGHSTETSLFHGVPHETTLSLKSASVGADSPRGERALDDCLPPFDLGIPLPPAVSTAVATAPVTLRDFKAAFSSTIGHESGSSDQGERGTFAATTGPGPPWTVAKPAAPKSARPHHQSGQDRYQGRPHDALPTFSRLSRLHNVLPMFWAKPLDTPVSVLQALAEIATRVLSDGSSVSITLYILDAWLQQEACKGSDQPPALFYLGQGKTQLQVLHQGGTRPEPPRFADLHSLPSRSAAWTAVSLLLPSTHRRVGVIQAHRNEAKDRGFSLGDSPKELRNILADDRRAAPGRELGFTDAHLMCLQLVCNIAGGLLEQLERLHKREVVMDRMRSCVDVVVAVNKAKSLPDFEQRVKFLLGTFFSAKVVRVLFYNAEIEKLVVSSSQSVQGAPARSKESQYIPLDKGVVGLCARRMQITYVPNIAQNAFVDAAADGIEKGSFSGANKGGISANAEILCGPMVVDYDEGGRLVGVVQLIERIRSKKKSGAGSDGEKKEWDADDQMLFSELLRVCAHCAWRTMKLQEANAKLEGQTGAAVAAAPAPGADASAKRHAGRSGR